MCSHQALPGGPAPGTPLVTGGVHGADIPRYAPLLAWVEVPPAGPCPDRPGSLPSASSVHPSATATGRDFSTETQESEGRGPAGRRASSAPVFILRSPLVALPRWPCPTGSGLGDSSSEPHSRPCAPHSERSGDRSVVDWKPGMRRASCSPPFEYAFFSTRVDNTTDTPILWMGRLRLRLTGPSHTQRIAETGSGIQTAWLRNQTLDRAHGLSHEAALGRKGREKPPTHSCC